MKLIITGSKGLIGSHLFEYAKAQKGVQVFGVDSVGRGNVSDYLSADLTDLGQTIDALDGADAVVHLAAIPSQRMFSASKTYNANAAMTWNVFEACARLGVSRVVAASSVQAIYTVTPRHPRQFPYFPIDEKIPVDPQDDYSMSKATGEHLGEMFAKHYGLTVVTIRPPWVARPEDLVGLPAEPGDDPVASSLWAYCDVRDEARAFFLAATAKLPAQSHTVAFCVAKDSVANVPSRELIKRHFPQAKIRGGLKGFDSLISGETAKRAFGFVPQYSCRNVTL
jgi:nucleoside-diphosphate-sugar epimerase